MPSSAAALLRVARQRSGLSQVDLASRAGVTQSVISTYEAGRRNPSFDMMTKLIAAAGATIEIQYKPRPSQLPDTPRGRMLRNHREEILTAVHLKGAGNVRVFGSVARGDDGPDSDFDLMIDIPDSFGLMDLSALTNRISEIMGELVDVIPARGLKAGVRQSAFDDAVPL